MLIWDLVKPLVTWSRVERERRLFSLCVQVQATLMTRYPGYQTTSQHEIPAALAAEAETLIKEILDA